MSTTFQDSQGNLQVERPTRLPRRTVIGYGVGDIFGGGSTVTINMFFLYFLTDVAGIGPGLAVVAIAVSKIWDAVTDPFMGIISDNTRTRFGRRRPYFLAGIFLIVVSFGAMWLVPGGSEAARFAYALGTYMLFSTVYTIVWVPYNALAAELTSDYDERSRLSTARIIFSNLAGIVCAMTARDFFVGVVSPDDPRRGFAVMGVVLGLMFAVPYILTISACRENPSYMREPRRRIDDLKSYIVDNFLAPFRLRAFRHVALMYLFGFMVVDSVIAMAVYLMQYFLGIDNTFTLLVPVYGGMLAVMPFVRLLSGRIGKRSTYLVAGAVWLGAFSLVPFLSPAGRTWIVYVFGVLFGVGASAVQVMVFAMFPDVPDADELFSGRRREGVYSGVFAFLRKSGSAATIFLVGTGMNLIGYRRPVEQIVDGRTVMVAQEQSDAFLSGIKIVFMGLPLLFGALALFAAYGYPLSRQRLVRLKRVVAARRTGTDTDALGDEEAALRRELQEPPRRSDRGGVPR